jgi:phosphatidylinositol 4-phosphatase
LEKQIRLYGKQTLVSLIDQRGNELEVGEEYETQARLFANPDVQYVAYDFHEECKNNNYAKLDDLVHLVSPYMLAGQYFLKDVNGNILVEQRGNIRTNCIDCLDRTNVVQSQFGRFMLKQQFANLGIMSRDQEFDRGFINCLNSVWTNNADTLSKRYTGVGALKTDFTRTGKRSAKGAMADGMKSVSRLIQSTFNDDSKQDSIEFFLGKFQLTCRAKYAVSIPAGVKRFKVLKKNSLDSKGKHFIVQIDSNDATISTYDVETTIAKQYPISTIFRISR